MPLSKSRYLLAGETFEQTSVKSKMLLESLASTCKTSQKLLQRKEDLGAALDKLLEVI